MLTGAHVIIYAHDAEKARAFFRDVFQFPHVDAGGGWLIFALPPAELAAHPVGDGSDVDTNYAGRHELFFVCDDVYKTVDELKRKGVEFTRPITDQGWGILTTLKAPGVGEISLYQAKHPMPKHTA